MVIKVHGKGRNSTEEKTTEGRGTRRRQGREISGIADGRKWFGVRLLVQANKKGVKFKVGNAQCRVARTDWS